MLTRLVVTLLIPVAFAIAGCSSLPREVENRAAKVNEALGELAKSLETRRSAYVAMRQNADDWAFFAPYAERENWTTTFDEVETDLAGLRSRYEQKAVPILEEDKPEGATVLTEVLDGITANFNPLKERMRSVAARMQLLREGYENAETWNDGATTYVASIKTIVDAVGPVIRTTKTDFSGRADAIDERFAPLSKLLGDAEAALATVRSEYAKHTSGADTDYAMFTDAYMVTKKNAESAPVADADYRAQLESLYKEYTVVLRDMKTEYALIIGRSTWDNCCDGSRYESTTAYPEVRISKADYEHLISLPQGDRKGAQGYLARLFSGWTAWSEDVFIEKAVWDRIGVDMKASWPNGHDDSMYWVEDIYPVYYHKFAETNGTTVIEGKWEEADEIDYVLHLENFGMAIESKALGEFADEATEEAVPPGMDKIGDPRYGEWVSDGQGGERWSWLEMYAFYHLLFGGSDPYYYSRADYRDYRGWRDERRSGAGTYGWYGRDRAAPAWGSSGRVTTRTASYQSSPFGRAGGTASVPRSVRNAGASVRARGPAGGGK